MEIGEPQREVTYEPLEDPFVEPTPAPAEPAPVEPVKEPVHARLASFTGSRA